MRRQSGVAIITALLLTTLAITIVASLFWQQQVQVRSMENQRLHLQTKWISLGAIDFERFILRQDGLAAGAQITTLDGIWATPVAETRLDQYIDRERVADEHFDATLSGQISDAQARYNLNNLAGPKLVNPAQVLVFQRLLSNLQLDPGLAQAAAQALAKARPPQAAPLVTPPPGTATPPPAPSTTPAAPPRQGGPEPVEFTQVEDLLSVPGFTPQAIERLRDFVIVLPEPTTVNVNTAAPEVLAALAENFSVSEATALAVFRKRTPFVNPAAFTAYLAQTGKTLARDVDIDVKSSYFLAMSRVRLDRAALDAQALIRRDLQQKTYLVWIREN